MVANAGAKGDLALTVDELGLEASFRFTPNAEGAEWTADKVMRLVMDARIGGVTQKRVEDILGKFARSRAPVVEIIAKGQAPEDPVPEEVEWEELTPPVELDALVAATIAAGSLPELYRIRVETVNSEKTVKKPGAFPFLPPKIEKIAVQERREVKERVYPDVEVLKTGFAKRGQRLGLLSSSKPGKSGKSIFGKPITPEARDSAFILGSGIIRNKNELLADADGALRAGNRWVEIIPLAIPSWSVAKSADGGTWLLDYKPGDARLPAPNAADILSVAVSKGAVAETLLSAEVLSAILREAAGTNDALFSKSISSDRDGKAEVTVSPDGIRAALSLWKSRGAGAPLQLSAVSAALKASGVRMARPEQIKKDVLEFQKGEAMELLDYVIAEGKAPTRGKDRTVALNAAFMPDEKAEQFRLRIQSNAALASTVPSIHEFPLEAGMKLAFVQEGQRFGELSAQVSGQGGVDLKGKVLPGIPGNDPAIRILENVVYQKGVISASIPGLLFCSEKERSWSFRVVPFKDSTIDITIAADSMAAYINLQAEVGLGEALTVESCLKALADKGVVLGLDAKAVAEAVAAARAGQVVLRRPVAEGTPPRPAGTGRRLWLIGADAPKDGAKPSGPGPFRVAAGTPILRIEAPTGGAADGKDVLGKPVPAAMAPASAEAASGPMPVPELGFQHDATIREQAGAVGSKVGDLTYVAVVAGELRVEGNKISIIDRLVVKGDIGEATGNLRFAGPVQVAGSIRRGLQLFAGGDAAIAGHVEAGLVSSEGSIAINGGIKGERRGTLRAKRCIDVGFAEQALLLAVEDVRVRGGCVLCSVKTNGRIFVTGEKGTLVGGICRARKGVDAASIGSANGIKTEISFGQDYLMADMIEAEDREIEKIKTLILQSDRTMAEAERIGSGLDQARQDKIKLVKLLEKRSIRLFDLREKYEEHFAASEVIVHGIVYPGVILESHNRFFEVRSKRTNVSFAFDPQQGRIVERQL